MRHVLLYVDVYTVVSKPAWLLRPERSISPCWLPDEKARKEHTCGLWYKILYRHELDVICRWQCLAVVPDCVIPSGIPVQRSCPVTVITY